MDCAYIFQEYTGQSHRKTSEGKATWPGRKQVFREFDAEGMVVRNHVSLETSAEPGEPLLVPMIQNGR